MGHHPLNLLSNVLYFYVVILSGVEVCFLQLSFGFINTVFLLTIKDYECIMDGG